MPWRLVTGWPNAKTMQFYIWIYGRGCILIFRPFLRLKRENLQCEKFLRPGIIVMNHQSFFDTYFFGLLPVYDAHVCLRSWPFKMFWYSLFMRLAEFFDLEALPWEEILSRAEVVFRNKRYLIIFPEAHRSRTGKAGRFHSGAFKLAIELKVPILPLCISGTGTLLPPGRKWVRPARIVVRLLEPVFPDQFTGERPHIQMCKQVRAKMTEAIEQMDENKTDANG